MYFDGTNYDALLQSHFQSACSHTVHIGPECKFVDFHWHKIIHVASLDIL